MRRFDPITGEFRDEADPRAYALRNQLILGADYTYNQPPELKAVRFRGQGSGGGGGGCGTTSGNGAAGGGPSRTLSSAIITCGARASASE